MHITNINHTIYGPVLIDKPNQTIHVGLHGSVVRGKIADGPVHGAIVEDFDLATKLHDNNYVINGRLFDPSIGLFTAGRRDRIKVGDTGEIHGGSAGVELFGNGGTLVNAGEIGSSSGYGVYNTRTNGAHLVNTGLISGETALSFQASHTHIVNGSDGVIAASQLAISVLNTADKPAEIVNHGRITAGGSAVSVFVGAAHLVNDGLIKGDVRFDAGDDIFDNRDGIVKGQIFGGTGDDTLITNHARDHLLENADAGFDKIKATVSYLLDANVEQLFLLGTADINGIGTDQDNLLRGNKGDNKLMSLGGADRLDGKSGADRLFGGLGVDTFVFATGYGEDKIEDFSVADGDLIDLTEWKAIRNLNQLIKHADDHGNDVWITSGHDILVIDHIHEENLAALSSQFVFG